MNRTSTPVHSAGVLAHGLHAVADHIFTHQLDLIGIDVQPQRLDGSPVIQVRVAEVDLQAWMSSTLGYTSLRTDTTDRFVHSRRTVRLPDTAVVVDILTTTKRVPLTQVSA